MSRSSSRTTSSWRPSSSSVSNLLFDHRQTELIEPGRLLAGERLVAEVGQRLATEEGERLPELFRPGRRDRLPAPVAARSLEPTDVHLVPVRQPQEIAGVCVSIRSGPSRFLSAET